MGRPISYLLDTHVLLWWLNGDPRISPEREQQLSRHVCFISAASIWEVAIKSRLGKLPLDPASVIQLAGDAGFKTLPISQEHAAITASLPPLHQDPFDRLLLAQAQAEGLRLISAAADLLLYGPTVERL